MEAVRKTLFGPEIKENFNCIECDIRDEKSVIAAFRYEQSMRVYIFQSMRRRKELNSFDFNKTYIEAWNFRFNFFSKFQMD